MDRIIELLNEIYDLTVRQENAVNLGLMPRFMRLLEEKQVKLEEIDKIDVEKNVDLISDENQRNQVKELLDKIRVLNEKNMENMKKQKLEIKKEIGKLSNAKNIVESSYGQEINQNGHYVDNKK